MGAVTVYAPFPKFGHNPVVCDYRSKFDLDLETDVYDEILLKYLWQRLLSNLECTIESGLGIEILPSLCSNVCKYSHAAIVCESSCCIEVC